MCGGNRTSKTVGKPGNRRLNGKLAYADVEAKQRVATS